MEETADTAESIEAVRGAATGRGSGLLSLATDVMVAGDEGAAESCEVKIGAETFRSCVVERVCKTGFARVPLPVGPSFPPEDGASPAKSASRRSRGERGPSRAEAGGETGERGEVEEAENGKVGLLGLAEDRAALIRSSPDALDVRLA